MTARIPTEAEVEAAAHVIADHVGAPYEELPGDEMQKRLWFRDGRVLDINTLSKEEADDVARVALAAAYAVSDKLEAQDRQDGGDTTSSGAQDVLPRSAPTVPEGWRLVPVEPTEAMVCAGDGKDPGFGSLSAKIWAAMLSAAPAGEVER